MANILQPTSFNATQLAQFDLAISLTLHTWPALTLAVQNQWGGEDSTGKRDWFCGAISDLFAERPTTDQTDLEDVLLQVMADEFDINLEDESELDIAALIMKLRKEISLGEPATLNKMRSDWEARRGKEVRTDTIKGVDNQEEEGDWDSVDEESDDDDDDEDRMQGVEVTAKPKEKSEPEVDEEGFTKVVGKKKR